MGVRTLNIRRNADGTVTISSGGYKESINVREKTPEEKYDAVKWAILTAGFAYSEQIEELVREELGFWK
jgi:hypothetical protein